LQACEFLIQEAREPLKQEKDMNQQTLMILDSIRKNIIASAVLREAGRLAESRSTAGPIQEYRSPGTGKRISELDIQWAVADFAKTFVEIQ
jgi:hypothetical protein